MVAQDIDAPLCDEQLYRLLSRLALIRFDSFHAPEGRRRAPTAERVFDVFRDVRRHRLKRADGTVHRCFYDEVTELQHTALRGQR